MQIPLAFIGWFSVAILIVLVLAAIGLVHLFSRKG